MKNYDLAFGTYSIRNIYPDIVDETLSYSLWISLWKHLLTQSKDSNLIFWGDGRQANNHLIYAFLCGLETAWFYNYINAGKKVDCVEWQYLERWVGSSASLYYLTKDAFDLWVMFTASHNPPEYAWIKVVSKDGNFVSTSRLKGIVNEYKPFIPDHHQPIEHYKQNAKGKSKELIERVDTRREKLITMILGIYKELTSPIKIVVDYTNWWAISDEKTIFTELKKESENTIIEINDLADSNFTAHLWDTTDPYNYRQLQDVVKENHVDIWIIFDGDADRLGIVDETGRFIWWDIVVALIAKYLLSYSKKDDRSKSVIYDISSSNTVPELVKELGGEPVPCAVWMVFLKEKFHKHNALFWWELSGHIFFPESNWCESPLLALYYLLALVQKEEKALSVLIDEISSYYKPPLINYSTPIKLEILERIKKRYPDDPHDMTDGIRVNGDWRRILVRASNTEPFIRLYIEANSKEIYDQKLSEVEKVFGDDCKVFSHH